MTEPPWVPLAVGDVAAELGVSPTDPRLPPIIAATIAWVEHRRPYTPQLELWAEPDVVRGALLFAALLYQSRVTPSGLPGYDAEDSDTYEALSRARELVRKSPVVA
jgi:hypothetical protein